MDKLIIGLDIQNEYSQICYYNEAAKEPESVVREKSLPLIKNAFSLKEIFETNEDGRIADIDKLSQLIKDLLVIASSVCKCNVFEKISICIDNTTADILKCYRDAMQMIGIPKDNFQIIGREESFAYYAFSQKNELCSHGALLVDYTSNGLKICYLYTIAGKSKKIILEKYFEGTDEDILRTYATKDLPVVADTIISYMESAISNVRVSSIYLTGGGFDTSVIPDKLIKYACSKGRVFGGQNLFVKGACYCACESLNNEHFSNTILACRNRITTSIETEICSYGKSKTLVIAKAGNNWYDESKQFEFLVKEMNSIILKMQPVASKESYEEIIDLSSFPNRDGAMTRIRMDVNFSGDDRCMITVSDLGFGDFFPSSGKVVYKDLDLSIQ